MDKIISFVFALVFLSTVYADENIRFEFHTLSIELAKEWQIKDKTNKPEYIDGMEFIVFSGNNQKTITLMRFPKIHYIDGKIAEPIDRGPMIVAEQESIIVAGKEIELITTKLFFGNTEKVLVIHIETKDYYYLIYGKNVSKPEFANILATVKQ